MKILSKNILQEQYKFAVAKANYSIWKKMFFSFMGGLFIGIGYIGYLTIAIHCHGNPLYKYFAASLFPVGILLCMFLGGNLFTSNTLIFAGVIVKDIKWRVFLSDMLITWVFNAIGGITMAAIAFGANIFGKDIDVVKPIIDLAEHKFNLEWYEALLSGIICNILVAGSIFAYNSLSNKGIGVFVVYITIFLFAVSGTQHIVANYFIFSEAGFIQANINGGWSSEQVGMIFYNNLIPTTFGNFIGGSIIPVIYLMANGLNKPKFQTIITVSEEKKEEK